MYLVHCTLLRIINYNLGISDGVFVSLSQSCLELHTQQCSKWCGFPRMKNPCPPAVSVEKNAEKSVAVMTRMSRRTESGKVLENEPWWKGLVIDTFVYYR